MSSSNHFDIKALLAQLQQQQQQGPVASNTSDPGSIAFPKQVQDSAVPAGISVSSPNSSIATSVLLSNCLEAIKSKIASSGAPSTHAVPQAFSNPGNPMDLQALQKLLTSAKLLSSINPKLAAAAIEQALSLTPQLLVNQTATGAVASVQQDHRAPANQAQVTAPSSFANQQVLLNDAQKLHSSLQGQGNGHTQSSSIPSLDPRNLPSYGPAYLSFLSKALTNASSASSSTQKGVNLPSGVHASISIKNGPSDASFIQVGGNIPQDMHSLLSSVSKAMTNEVRIGNSPLLGTSALTQQSHVKSPPFTKSASTSASNPHDASVSALLMLSKTAVKRASTQSSGNANAECTVQPSKDHPLIRNHSQSVNDAKASHSDQVALLRRSNVEPGTIAGPARAMTGTSSTSEPPPGSLSTWQNWDLAQLESYSRRLQKSNQPIPNAVKILIEVARQKERRRENKRVSNRKSAIVCRERKKRLIDNLIADNAKLRRQALVLNFLPDPMILIDIEGEIKFCNLQVQRVLGHKVNELLGANIAEITVPCSRAIIQNLIGNDLEESLSTNANVISHSSGSSLKPLDDSVKDKQARCESTQQSSPDDSRIGKTVRNLKSSCSSMSFLTERSLSASTEASTGEDGKGPPMKKLKITMNSQNKTNSSCNDTDDSGYSSGNSDDTSSMSGHSESCQDKGRPCRRFASAYTVRLIRNDLTAILCEMTCSTFFQPQDVKEGESDSADEDSKSAPEKERLLCFRPISEDQKVGEEFRFQPK